MNNPITIEGNKLAFTISKEYFNTSLIKNVPLLYSFSRLYQEIKSQKRNWKGSTFLLMALINKKNFHVLLADDDDDDREIFIDVLKEIAPSVTVSSVTSGQALMETLNDNTIKLPDIIFLDLNMPLKNGQECLEDIRKDKRLNKIPVIIYSTSSSHEHIDETYKKGADFYVRKPDSVSDLKLIAGKLLAHEWEAHTRPKRDQFFLTASGIK